MEEKLYQLLPTLPTKLIRVNKYLVLSLLVFRLYIVVIPKYWLLTEYLTTIIIF